MENLSPVLLALIGTSISFAGTAIGAAFVFLTKKELNSKMQKLFLGFASGVMIAASVWSLLLPSIDYASQQNVPEWIPCCIGFLSGGLFLLLLDKVLPHHHAPTGITEGPNSSLRKSTKLILAVTLHNFPEGMAVGLAFALAGFAGSGVTLASAFALAIGIAIQNLPEGAVISMPLRSEGFSRKKAFLMGTMSGIVEPIAGVLSALLAYLTFLVIPWVLAFAAGAMIYVVIDELVPSSQDSYSDIGTIGALFGFVVMMLLDVALG